MNSQAVALGPAPTAERTPPLLIVSDLVVDYPIGRRKVRRAVDEVNLAIAPGETLGVVGESGSGKSTIGKAVLGLAPTSEGSITFEGNPIGDRHPRTQNVVADLQVIFQDPYSSLDPTKRIGYSIAEPLLALHAARGEKITAGDVRTQVADMLERVGLPASAAERYPAQFSGGQRQRIAIARALIVKPRLVICDEVVSALDLSVQAQVINLLEALQNDLGLAYLFIGHDLSVVEHVSDRVLVLYRGRVMETGDATLVHRSPEHPYTRALVAAAPVQDPTRQRERREERRSLRVTPARPAPLGENCPFAHRCRFATDRCRTERPALQPMPDGRLVACHYAGGIDPTVQSFATDPEVRP